MTQQEFAHFRDRLNALTSDQMRLLRNELELRLAVKPISKSVVEQLDEILEPRPAPSSDRMTQACHDLDDQSALESKRPCSDDEELQRRLVEAGLLSEIKPPITDFAPYTDRKTVPVQGESLSETVIRERR